MATKRGSALDVAVLVVGLVAIASTDVLAYVDPGTGSYLFQLAVAGLLAGAFTIRRYWDAVKARFSRQSIAGRAADPSHPRE